MTTPTARFYGYPKRPVPDIFGGSDWDVPMTDRDSDSIFFLVEYLKITDPEKRERADGLQITSRASQRTPRNGTGSISPTV